METTKLISIDCGNADYKAVTANGTMKYPAGYEVLDYEPEADDAPVIGYGGKWLLFSQKKGVDFDKTKDQRMFVSCLPAIGEALLNADLTRTQTVSLAIGQTIEFYDRDKQAFAEYFKSRGADAVKFTYKGKTIKFKIRQDTEGVFCLPQGQAIYAAHSKELKGVYDFLNIIEIGSQTTDVTVIENNRINKTASFSVDLAINELFRRIDKRQVAKTRDHISDHLIRKYIETGKLLYGNSEINQYVKNVITEEIDSFVKDLVREVKKHGINLQVPVILAGGGSMLLWNALKDNFCIAEDDDGEPIKYDEYENARAFKVVATALRRKMREQQKKEM